MNGPLKNEKFRQILPKSRNLTQPTNGSQSLRFCVCQSQLFAFRAQILKSQSWCLGESRIYHLPPQLGYRTPWAYTLGMFDCALCISTIPLVPGANKPDKCNS